MFAVRTHPELLGRRARSKLVVLAVEVGGRWSGETRMFLSLLARAKVRWKNPHPASLVSPVAQSRLQ